MPVRVLVGLVDVRIGRAVVARIRHAIAVGIDNRLRVDDGDLAGGELGAVRELQEAAGRTGAGEAVDRVDAGAGRAVVLDGELEPAADADRVARGAR
jgi:ABC-type sugar transport system substrate-binding protein